MKLGLATESCVCEVGTHKTNLLCSWESLVGPVGHIIPVDLTEHVGSCLVRCLGYDCGRHFCPYFCKILQFQLYPAPPVLLALV